GLGPRLLLLPGKLGLWARSRRPPREGPSVALGRPRRQQHPGSDGDVARRRAIPPGSRSAAVEREVECSDRSRQCAHSLLPPLRQGLGWARRRPPVVLPLLLETDDTD